MLLHSGNSLPFTKPENKNLPRDGSLFAKLITIIDTIKIIFTIFAGFLGKNLI